MGWKYALPNILGQIFMKWLILSLMFSIYSVAKALVEASLPNAEKMSFSEGFWKRVILELKIANPGLTSPMLRIVDVILYNIVKPMVEGRSEYTEAWNEYFSGELSRLGGLLERVRGGENAQDPQVDTVLQTVDTPVVQGTPIPANDTPRTDNTLPSFIDSIPQNRIDSNRTSRRDTTQLRPVPGFDTND
jgi:hypothetical protein